MIQEITTKQELDSFLEQSHQQPVFLLKHSTRCPVSAKANRAFEAFAGTTGQACGRLLVIEQRELSNLVAARTGIRHESPQAFLFFQGVVCWNASHGAITEDSLQAARQKM